MELYKYTSDLIENNYVTGRYSSSCNYLKADFNWSDKIISEVWEDTGDIIISYESPSYVFGDPTIGNEEYYDNYEISDLVFICDSPFLENENHNKIEGVPYYESLNLFARLNNEIDKLLFDNVEQTLIDLGGTFINTSITTKTVSYCMSITCIILFFIGILQFFKRIFQLIGGR